MSGTLAVTTKALEASSHSCSDTATQRKRSRKCPKSPAKIATKRTSQEDTAPIASQSSKTAEMPSDSSKGVNLRTGHQAMRKRNENCTGQNATVKVAVTPLKENLDDSGDFDMGSSPTFSQRSSHSDKISLSKPVVLVKRISEKDAKVNKH